MDHCRVCGQHIHGTYCGEAHAMAAARIEAETVAAIVAWLRAAGDPPEGWDYTIADRIARGDWRPKPGGSHG